MHVVLTSTSICCVVVYCCGDAASSEAVWFVETMVIVTSVSKCFYDFVIADKWRSKI